MSNKAPLLFDAEPSESDRYIRGLEAEQAFSVVPNAGQIWQIRAGQNEKGEDVYKDVKIIAIANTEPNSPQPPTVVFRNSRKKLNSWPLADWVDNDTFYVGKANER